jgi:GYF domain 2
LFVLMAAEVKLMGVCCADDRSTINAKRNTENGAAMERDWYYKLEGWGEPLGPLSASELRQQAANGVVDKTTRVREGENGRWVPAGTVEALRRGIIDSPKAKVNPKPLQPRGQPQPRQKWSPPRFVLFGLELVSFLFSRQMVKFLVLYVAIGGPILLVIFLSGQERAERRTTAQPASSDAASLFLDIARIPNLLDPPLSGGDGFIAPGSHVLTEEFRREISERIMRAGFSREVADAFTKTLNEEQQRHETSQQ